MTRLYIQYLAPLLAGLACGRSPGALKNTRTAVKIGEHAQGFDERISPPAQYLDNGEGVDVERP